MEQEQYNWVSKRAHEIWQQEGCPDGRDREHWLQAVAEREALDRLEIADRQEDVGGNIDTVLVVDDEPIIRYAAVDALEQAGFQVLEAGNADEALALLQNREVDAVFTDINMPGSIDGLGLVSRVRARSPRTRVIVTSGHVRLGAFDLASGVSFLSKPYDVDTLVGMLKSADGAGTV